MWQRSAFLRAAGAGFAASLLPQRAAALADAELVFASSVMTNAGTYGAALITETGGLITNIDLPDRGHDVTYSPVLGRAVVFARQPGTFAVVFDPVDRAAPLTIPSIEGRHFFGHGVFRRTARCSTPPRTTSTPREASSASTTFVPATPASASSTPMASVRTRCC